MSNRTLIPPMVLARAAAEWRCVRDATTLDGLAQLQANHPKNWADIMAQYHHSVGPDPTLAQALRAGAKGRLLPRASTEAEARRIKRPRHCARRLIAVFGDVLVRDIDERWMRTERERVFDRLSPSRELTSRCFTLLRQAGHGVQLAAGRVRLHGRLRAKSRQAQGAAPLRQLADWGSVEQLIEKGPYRIRAALALQLHVGLTPGRVLQLRVGDVDLANRYVSVWVRDARGERVRVSYPLPFDAARAIRPWHTEARADRGKQGRLFPKRGAPKQATVSINRAIARAAVARKVQPVTMAGVRRIAQASLRDLGATRAQVRGSVRARGRTTARRSWRPRPEHRGSSLAEMRGGWPLQYGGSATPGPQRAPARCKWNEREARRAQPPRSRVDEGLGVEPTPLRRGIKRPVAGDGELYPGIEQLGDAPMMGGPFPDDYLEPVAQPRVAPAMLALVRGPSETIDRAEPGPHASGLDGEAVFIGGVAVGFVAREVLAATIRAIQALLKQALRRDGAEPMAPR